MSRELAVVVPAWNEGDWLPRLFQSLRATGIRGPIVVADNNSSDETAVIARSNGAKVVQGGRPARGRNVGARATSGESLLFVDADVVLDPCTLHAAIDALEEPGVVAAHVRLRPLCSHGYVRLCYWAMHVYFSALNRLGRSQGVGSFILVRRDAFDAIGGFREDVAVGEDADFFRRVRRIGRVAYISRVVHVSPRRFRVENPIWFSAKCVLWAMLRLTGTSRSVLKYPWVKYPRRLTRDEQCFVGTDKGARA